MPGSQKTLHLPHKKLCAHEFFMWIYKEYGIDFWFVEHRTSYVVKYATVCCPTFFQFNSLPNMVLSPWKCIYRRGRESQNIALTTNKKKSKLQEMTPKQVLKTRKD
jgi:hypothetical protein